jgi:hypothetical protein
MLRRFYIFETVFYLQEVATSIILTEDEKRAAVEDTIFALAMGMSKDDLAVAKGEICDYRKTKRLVDENH